MPCHAKPGAMLLRCGGRQHVRATIEQQRHASANSNPPRRTEACLRPAVVGHPAICRYRPDNMLSLTIQKGAAHGRCDGRETKDIHPQEESGPGHSCGLPRNIWGQISGDIIQINLGGVALAASESPLRAPDSSHARVREGVEQGRRSSGRRSARYTASQGVIAGGMAGRNRRTICGLALGRDRRAFVGLALGRDRRTICGRALCIGNSRGSAVDYHYLNGISRAPAGQTTATVIPAHADSGGPRN